MEDFIFECKLCGHKVTGDIQQLPSKNPLNIHLKENHKKEYDILDDFTFEPDGLTIMSFYKVKSLSK